MAAALADRLYRQSGWDTEIQSAGLAVFAAQPASVHAADLMRDENLDISGHRSRMVTQAMAGEADLILTMTQAHKAALLARFSRCEDKTFTLGEYAGNGADIPDPFGGGRDLYRACADLIAEQLRGAIEKIARIYSE